MNQWTMNLSLRDPPICPICGCDLLTDVTRFRRCFAMCALCFERILPNEVATLARAVEEDLQTRNYTTINGLLFYTPRAVPAPREPLFHTLTGEFISAVPSYDQARADDERRAVTAGRRKPVVSHGQP